MSTEKNENEAVGVGLPSYEQTLPHMNTTELPPPDFEQILPEVPPSSVANPPPYHINIPIERNFSKHTMFSFSGTDTSKRSDGFSSNNQDVFPKPPPIHNPEFLTPQISQPTPPGMVLPQPILLPPSAQAGIPGMMPPLPSTGPVFYTTVQPTVVTTQTTMYSMDHDTPYYRDYLSWSICNLLCCCWICGLVALIFSIQTQSAMRYRNWESARKYSKAALGLNLTSTLLGIAFIIIGLALYLSYSSSTSYSSSSSYSNSHYYG